MILHGLGDPWGGIMILKNSPQSGIMFVKTGGIMTLKIPAHNGIMFVKNHRGSESRQSETASDSIVTWVAVASTFLTLFVPLAITHVFCQDGEPPETAAVNLVSSA